MASCIIKTKHINSKALQLEISEFVEGIIEDFNVIWTSDSQRDAILEVIDEHLETLSDNKKIDASYRVVCDASNNKKSDVKSDITHLDIMYTQYNCYNISELNYTIGK